MVMMHRHQAVSRPSSTRGRSTFLPLPTDQMIITLDHAGNFLGFAAVCPIPLGNLWYSW